MNNIIDFLKRYFHIILFLVLQIICIVMIYNTMSYPQYVMGKTARKITYPFNKLWSNVVKHFNYEKENTLLMTQYMELLREKEENFTSFSDTTYTKEEFNEKNKIARLYDYTNAHVVYNSINKIHNYLIIDKGKKDGITTDMAITSPLGIIGVVCDVSTNFATVMSILHPDSRVSARIMPANQIGTIIWEGHNAETVYLQDIPQHIAINIGDSVFTSGFSNVFPKNLLIGTIEDVEKNDRNSFYTIKVKLATNLGQVNQVYVIKNLYKNEIDSLKSRFKDE